MNVMALLELNAQCFIATNQQTTAHIERTNYAQARVLHSHYFMEVKKGVQWTHFRKGSVISAFADHLHAQTPI